MPDDDSLENFGDSRGVEEERKPSKKKGQPEVATTPGEDGKKSFDYAQWASYGDGVYSYSGKTMKALKPAAYSYFVNNEGRFFLKIQTQKTDELLEFPESPSNDIVEEIEKFWDRKEVFKKFKFLHKRGYILWGDAGCGKTGIVQLIIKKMIERNGIVILVSNPDILSQIVQVIREIEPDRHIVCIMEDIDALIHDHGEGGILNFLDGENQTDDILTIATTNYPERLDRRIVARPRRFDRRIKVLPPDDRMRREFFVQKLGITQEEVETWVENTRGYTFASMADLVIQVKCLDIPMERAIEVIRKLTKDKPSSDESTKTGFTVK